MRQANRLLGSGSRKTGCFGCTLEAGKSWCPSLKTGRQEEFFLCVLFGTSTNWVRTTTLEKVTCFPQPIDVLLNINFIQKPLHRDTEDNVWAPCDPVKLTNKISHHNTLTWLWSYIPILMFLSSVVGRLGTRLNLEYSGSTRPQSLPCLIGLLLGIRQGSQKHTSMLFVSIPLRRESQKPTSHSSLWLMGPQGRGNELLTKQQTHCSHRSVFPNLHCKLGTPGEL